MVKPDIKRFCKSFFFIVVIIYLLDLVIGSGLKYLYNNQASGYLYRTNYAIDSTTSRYLVLGSSRANHHYDSKIFEEELKSTFYNCGRDGQNIIYSCALTSAIITRYKPEMIIIDVLPNEFTAKDEDRLSSLLPYHDNTAIKPFLKYYSPFEDIKLISHIYPYNSLLTSLIAGLSSQNRTKSEDYHGYSKLEGVLTDQKLDEFRESGQVDSVKIRVFSALLNRLHDSRIPTLVIFSPLYFNYKPTISAIICDSLCSKFKSVKFLNFADYPEFKDPMYYNDVNHLNESGAKLFSKKIVKSIQLLENENP